MKLDRRWPYALFLGALSFWTLLMLFTPIQSNDLWWHLASGRWIAQNHVVPDFDVFSLTARSSGWINTYWLFDLLLFHIFELGGLVGVVAAKALLIWAILFIIERDLRQSGVHWIGRAIAWLWIFFAASPRGVGWLENASLVSLLGVAWLLKDLRRWHITGVLKHAWCWPVIFAVWANLHRGFALGWVLAALYCVFEQPIGLSSLRKRLPWLFACGAMTFLNPFGWKIFTMMRDDVSLSTENVAGWANAPWMRLELYWISLALFIVFLLVQLRRRERKSTGFVVMTLFLAVLSVRHVFNEPFFIVAAVPLMVVYLSCWLNQRDEPTSFDRWLQLAGAVVCLAFASQVPVSASLNPQVVPKAACDFIEAHLPLDPVYEEYAFGGYWMWRFGPKRPVFIDGRYPAVEGYIPLMDEINGAKSSDPKQWNAFLSSRGVQTVLIKYPAVGPYPSMTRIYFPPELWQLVFWDDAAMVLIRKTPLNRSVIQEFGFNAFYPDTRMRDFEAMVQASPKLRREFEAELLENLKRNPRSERAKTYLDRLRHARSN